MDRSILFEREGIDAKTRQTRHVPLNEAAMSVL
jgi:hypothetical protein